MSFVHQPVWSSPYTQLDPQRTSVREEIREQAVRDATAATEVVRAKLRRNLAVAVKARERARARRSSVDGSS